MEEFKLEDLNDQDIQKIYNHIGRIINKINKRSFNKTFNLELDDFINTSFDGYTYLIPLFSIDDSFIQLNYDEIGDFLMEQYGDMVIIEWANTQEYIAVAFEVNINHESFRNTLDLDDESFDLWFKLQYGT